MQRAYDYGLCALGGFLIAVVLVAAVYFIGRPSDHYVAMITDRDAEILKGAGHGGSSWLGIPVYAKACTAFCKQKWGQEPLECNDLTNECAYNPVCETPSEYTLQGSGEGKGTWICRKTNPNYAGPNTVSAVCPYMAEWAKVDGKMMCRTPAPGPQ